MGYNSKYRLSTCHCVTSLKYVPLSRFTFGGALSNTMCFSALLFPLNSLSFLIYFNYFFMIIFPFMFCDNCWKLFFETLREENHFVADFSSNNFSFGWKFNEFCVKNSRKTVENKFQLPGG